MITKIATCSFQGGRDYNEDSVSHIENEGNIAVVVADGLGGHGGGQIASSIVADYVTRLFIASPDTDAQNIQSIFDIANNAVVAQQTQQLRMKSTAVCLFISGNVAVWSHAGDSRLYYFLDDRLVLHTLDHSVSQMAVFNGEITQEEIRSHEDRNKVLRAFGGGDEINADISTPLTMATGNHTFLLCTDGFWEYVMESEMELDLAKFKEPSEWLDSMCKRVNRCAPSNNDNFSAAAVFYHN